MKKVLLMSMVFMLVFLAGCFTTKKSEEKTEGVQSAQSGMVNEMEKAFAGVDLTAVDVKNLIALEAPKRGTTDDEIFVSGIVNEDMVKSDAEKSAEDLTLIGKYKENLVFSVNKRVINYDTKTAEIEYLVNLVGENNEMLVNGLVTAIYSWDGVEWKQNSAIFTKEEVTAESDIKRAGYPIGSPFYRNLYYVSSNYMYGNDVKVMQARLNEFFKEHNISYSLGTPDGYFGPNTRGAVIRFQQYYSALADDGIFGPASATTLWNNTNGTTTVSPVITINCPSALVTYTTYTVSGTVPAGITRVKGYIDSTLLLNGDVAVVNGSYSFTMQLSGTGSRVLKIIGTGTSTITATKNVTVTSTSTSTSSTGAKYAAYYTNNYSAIITETKKFWNQPYGCAATCSTSLKMYGFAVRQVLLTNDVESQLIRLGWRKVTDLRALQAGDVMFADKADSNVPNTWCHVYVFVRYADSAKNYAIINDNNGKNITRNLYSGQGQYSKTILGYRAP